jgi:hypothetical protein
MKIIYSFVLSVGFLFLISCKKEATAGSKTITPKKYMLQSASGTNAGSFTIGSDRDGKSVITIELEEKSHQHGTIYTASLCAPGSQNCYARLEDVNAVTGYSETTGVTEAASGRELSAAELFNKPGYRLSVSNSSGVIASGEIR